MSWLRRSPASCRIAVPHDCKLPYRSVRQRISTKFELGPLRAAFADVWETRVNMPVPVQALQCDNEAARGAGAKHYTTMTVEAICAEPVLKPAA